MKKREKIFKKRRMCDTDGTAAVSAATATDTDTTASDTVAVSTNDATSATVANVPAPATDNVTGAGANEPTPETPVASSTVEIKTEAEQRPAVKKEPVQKSTQTVRMTLNQAVEFELRNLDKAVNGIDSDASFIHKMINKRRDYLIGALQKMKCSRCTPIPFTIIISFIHGICLLNKFTHTHHTHSPPLHFISFFLFFFDYLNGINFLLDLGLGCVCAAASFLNDINKYKYLSDLSRKNSKRFKEIASEAPLRALNDLPIMCQRVADNISFASQKRKLETNENECATVIMYTGLDKDTANEKMRSMWGRGTRESKIVTDLEQCEISVEHKEASFTVGTPCTLIVNAKCKSKGMQLDAIDLVIQSDENPCTELQIDGKWRKVSGGECEVQSLKAKIEFSAPGNYTLYAQASFNEIVRVGSFVVEPSAKVSKGDTTEEEKEELI